MSTSVISGPPTSTTAPPAATTTGGGGGGGNGGPTSSPLLFFVALGFGVVFTNLWIIVGVKYCFRYNQRNRRAQQDENGEPIDMTAMPRQHRRRREKKLMSMDEVNERFPLVKYKAWMTSRAEEGLPTAGGVAAPSASRAASLRNAEGALSDDRRSEEEHRPSTPPPKQSTEENDSPETIKTSPEIISTPEPQPEQTDKKEVTQSKAENEEKETAPPPTTTPQPTQHEETPQSAYQLTTHATATTSSDPVDEDMDDDDQIQMAVPSEMLANPGDSCAICIDTLEDDDDVRGLTCGHAFHASCLDPWLTSRRACCPLCKADYYVPKPRPEGEAAADSERQDRGRRPPGARMDLPRPPQYAFQRPGGARMLFPGRFMGGGTEHNRHRYNFPARLPRPQRQARNAPSATPAVPPTTAPEVSTDDSPRPETWRSRMRNFVHTTPGVGLPLRRNNNGNNTTASAEGPSQPTTQNPNPTPAELEAGVR